MLFNKSNNGPRELQQLTGSYYASNSWERVNPFVVLAEEDLQDLLGEDIYNRLDEYYNRPEEADAIEGDELTAQLLDVYRMPLAYEAAFDLYGTNLVSHEDSGRKVKIDTENEKMAWEWMLDRDDLAQLRMIGRAKDRLIKFLDKHEVPEWMNSSQRLQLRELFVNSTALFHKVYPIDNSHAFFHAVKPFIAEVQREYIAPALGDHYDAQLQAWQLHNAFDLPEEGSGSSGGGLLPDVELDNTMLSQIQIAIPQLTMVLAVKRMSLKALPYGVVQQFKSMIQSRNASQAPLQQVIDSWVKTTEADAAKPLNKLKGYIRTLANETEERILIPKNDASNKFFRT